jgi:CPA2 family monovalent cation:H+ antiporter-2
MSGQASVSECSHLDQINPNLRPRSRGCEDCLAAGDRWVHLRMCLTCGKVGCCDDSKNKHATKHAASVGHPLVRSIEPGEDWAWCYEDEAFLEPVPQPPGAGAPLER